MEINSITVPKDALTATLLSLQNKGEKILETIPIDDTDTIIVNSLSNDTGAYDVDLTNLSADKEFSVRSYFLDQREL